MRPETRYARSGDIGIAYQVVGEGDMDLVVAFPFISHLDLLWDSPAKTPPQWNQRTPAPKTSAQSTSPGAIAAAAV